jgi:hypothetical protein
MLALRRFRAILDGTGRLAQLVERLLYTQDVGGSSPSPPTTRKLSTWNAWCFAARAHPLIR